MDANKHRRGRDRRGRQAAAESAIGRRAAFALLASAAAAGRARSQPLGRPARIVIGLPPGGSIDTTARLLADRLRGVYAAQVVVENRPGASTRLAVENVRDAAKDGSAVLMTPLPVMTLFPHVFPRTTRYDGLVDFIPVTTVAVVPYGFAVRADHPARTMEEFAAWGRGRRETDFAGPVPGSPQHMLGLEFARAAGFALNHVPYRGGAPATQAVVGGEIAAVFTTMGDLAGLHDAGTVRVLAVSGAERVRQLPAVPTVAESGFPALTMDEPYAIMLPAGTPAAVASALEEGVSAAVARPEMREALSRLGLTARALRSEDLVAALRSERERWGPIVRAAGFNGDA